MSDEAVDGPGSGPGNGGDIPDAALRKALAFALKVAAGARGPVAKVATPAGLKPYVRMQRLTPAALRAVRAVLESDGAFRAEVARRATSDHVDEIGRLWLSRPEEWTHRVAGLLEEQEAAAEAGAATSGAVTAEAKRRKAAEDKAERAQAELDKALRHLEEVAARVDELVAEREALQERVRGLTRQLDEEQRARARLAKEASRVDARAVVDPAETEQLRARLKEAEEARFRELEDWSATRDPVDLEALRALLDRAVRLVAPPADAPSKRMPLAIPGRLHGDDVGAAAHLLRAEHVEVLVDGYNVAKHAWPGLGLRDQRDRLLAMCERLARRFLVRITVVFDGQDVTGAHSKEHKVVRVMYTSSGELADDRLRAVVRSTPQHVPVVVVTSDGEVQRSVKAMGANVLANHVLPELDRR